MLKPEGGAERDDDELLANFEPPSKAGQEAGADEVISKMQLDCFHFCWDLY
jgi:hypothetical protein